MGAETYFNAFIICLGKLRTFIFVFPMLISRWYGVADFSWLENTKKPAEFSRYCGKTGIRTLGTVTRSPHFECGPIDHSGIFPCLRAAKVIPFLENRAVFKHYFAYIWPNTYKWTLWKAYFVTSAAIKKIPVLSHRPQIMNKHVENPQRVSSVRQMPLWQVDTKNDADFLRHRFYNYAILSCTLYSFGVHPATFLNSRLKWCGYWNPTS